MINIALIGAGGIAQSHIPALKKIPDKARVVGVADVVAERAREAAAKIGAERWTTDYRELLSWSAVDAVDICTPNATHGEIALAAASAGKHMLVEKPLTTNVEEADRLLALAERNHVQIMGGHTHRFNDYSLKMKEIVTSGEIGQPVYLRFSLYSPFWRSDWTRWILDPALSGGHMFQNGVHIMDLCNWWLGAQPVSVYAQGQKATSAYLSVYDYMHCLIKYQNDAIAVWEISRANQPVTTNYRAISLVGTKGALYLDTDTENDTIVREGGPEHVGLDGGHGFERMIREWVEALTNGTEPPCPGLAARLAVEMSAAGETSLATGKVVPIYGRSGV
ncbi:MAG: Gfo/Idh/MocA family oxidoreductase [Chloroflexi bacterium]|nr:Gfo/Idh/MocA family oxidoreductase [Chloroflexota bacterium]